MSDIVERLRGRYVEKAYQRGHLVGEMLKDAAAEIERLRGREERLVALLRTYRMDDEACHRFKSNPESHDHCIHCGVYRLDHPLSQQVEDDEAWINKAAWACTTNTIPANSVQGTADFVANIIRRHYRNRGATP